jgi:thiol-disulfide isomerase/thioredoxin
MFLSLLLSLALLALQQTPAPPMTFATAVTPGDCVKAARTFTAQRQREMMAPAPGQTTPTQLTAAMMTEITGQKNEQEKACAAKFDPKTLSPADLIALAEVRGDLGDVPGSVELITMGKNHPKATKTDIASAIVLQVNNGLREPKGDERNARLEKLVDELDALGPAAFEQQFTAHSRMNGYYRADDIDAGIIKHSTWLIKAGETCPPADRDRLAGTIASAHVNMAEAWAGQGMTDKALALLRSGAKSYGDISPRPGMTYNESYFKPEIERLELVGTTAAPIVAPVWLNGPANNELKMDGAVTLLEFTAHWCGPCRESYPGINRLRAKYGPQGFRVAQATQLYGYFQTERNLTPEAEIARDKAYFSEHQVGDVPLAISNQVIRKMVNGKVEQVTPEDPNYVNYKVGGIPQIHLIDKHGKIRLIMVGYDDANEAQLAKTIEALLNEK